MAPVAHPENQGVFLRKNRRRIDGETNECWTLCEAFRTERGPRQRGVATLGKLDEHLL